MNSSSNKVETSYNKRHNNKLLNNKRKSNFSRKKDSSSVIDIQKELQDIFNSVIQKLPNSNEPTKEQEDIVIEITDNEDYKSETESIDEYYNQRELRKRKKVMPLETQYQLIANFENEFKIGYYTKQDLINPKNVIPLEMKNKLISNFENEFKIKVSPTEIKPTVNNSFSLAHEEITIVAPKEQENTLSIQSSVKEQTTTVDSIHSVASVNSNSDSLITKNPTSVQSKSIQNTKEKTVAPILSQKIETQKSEDTFDSIQSKSPSTIENKNSDILTQLKCSSGQEKQNFLISNQIMLYIPVTSVKSTKSMSSNNNEQPKQVSSMKLKGKKISNDFELNNPKRYMNEEKEEGLKKNLQEQEYTKNPSHLRELHFEQTLRQLREQYLHKIQNKEENNPPLKHPEMFQTLPVIPMNREQILKSNYIGYPMQYIIGKAKTSVVCNPIKIQLESKNVKPVPPKIMKLVKIPKGNKKTKEAQEKLFNQNEEIIKKEKKEEDNDFEPVNNPFQLNFDVYNSYNNSIINNNKDDKECNTVEFQSMFFD